MDNLFDLMNHGTPDESDSNGKANAPKEFSVSEISQNLKRMVEDTFSYVRVRGELSRVTVAKSGHVYTSLKDESATLDAICWRGTASSLSITPEEGLDVVVTGRLTTYPGRSNYQIIIETMELAGEGALLKMLEERRKKLAAEGLFDESRKKPIPFLPKKIGVVTSPTGAVIRDIMHRLNDRFPRPVYLWPAVVQGEQAASQVIAGVQGFNNLPVDSPYRPDVIIVARGGGSLEDLMPFNDEGLVRAIAASDIPVICAVGHETDTSLADYAADLRAPTPTGAAEKAVPVRRDLIMSLEQSDNRLKGNMRRLVQDMRNAIGGLSRGLIHPKAMLENKAQFLDGLSNRLDHGLHKNITWLAQRLSQIGGRLNLGQRRQSIQHQNQNLHGLDQRLTRGLKQTIETSDKRLERAGALLESLSFQRTLERGYAIVKDANGQLITSARNMKAQDEITIVYSDGDTTATVK